MSGNVVVLGASAKPHRYANKAQLKLQQHGFRVIPVARKGGQVNGVDCLDNLAAVNEPVDTVTLYINPALLAQEIDALLALHPRRVIFNPGTEDDQLQARLQDNGIAVVEDCTLIMLDGGRF